MISCPSESSPKCSIGITASNSNPFPRPHQSQSASPPPPRHACWQKSYKTAGNSALSRTLSIDQADGLLSEKYLMGYTMGFKKLRATTEFTSWLDRLSDVNGRARIQARIQRLASGNPGKYRRLKFGVCELKVDSGPVTGCTTR